jgi:hypothetical protein
MKVGDLIIDPDGRKGVVTALIEVYQKCVPKEGVGMAFFFATAEEEIIYEQDVIIVGG